LENLEMKKTLVALAALAATSAFAQSFVTLSGRASMDVSTYQATGSTAGEASDLKNRVRVADTSSRITFAAQEDLGGGTKAGVYCETGINIDNGSSTGQADTNNANTSTFCSREGRMYYGNNTAEVRLGRQNVWWTQGALNEVGSTYLGADSATNLENGGVGVYTVRGENMIKLAANGDLGAFAGSEIYAGAMGMSGNAGSTNANGESATAAKGVNARYFGGKLLYTAGQYVAMWDHQNSTDAASVAASTTANTGSVGLNSFNRTANKVGLGFKYTPDSMVSLQYWAKSRTDVTTAGATYVTMFSAGASKANVTSAGNAKDSGYALVVKHALGGGLTLHGQYAKANNITASGVTQDDTGAKAYTLGLTKAVSKRTHFYTAYHVINNQANAAYNMTGGNYASGTSRTGADIKQVAFGMIHNF
jgi:predicted porin